MTHSWNGVVKGVEKQFGIIEQYSPLDAANLKNKWIEFTPALFVDSAIFARSYILEMADVAANALNLHKPPGWGETMKVLTAIRAEASGVHFPGAKF